MYKVVHKPWGKEEWLELNDSYCYKRIYINAGYKTSYQYHEHKKETNYIIEGEAEVWLENDEGVVEKKIMKAGDFFNVSPPKKHRVIAITDIILQEVSTPHVDDVIRIEDDTHREDGKIEGEHQTPAVLILAAGEGTRLGDLTKNINKALIPINNKAIISYIIEQFPQDYDFIIAVGYQRESLREYVNLAHPNINATFVDVDMWKNSGPGYSAFKCREYLQRPFYLTTADCILKDKLPHLDGNWLGVFPTSYPEKYSTVNTDLDNNVIGFINKYKEGFDNAFIGVAGIWDYKVFWKNLGFDFEVVRAFENPKSYPTFKAKQLGWFDTGNLDDLNTVKLHFNDKPLSLHKETNEITYNVGRKFLKFNPVTSKNKAERAKILGDLIPGNFQSTDNFIAYDWEPGNTMYVFCNKPHIYMKFLNFLFEIIDHSHQWVDNIQIPNSFYIDKTEERKQQFINKFGIEYFTNEYIINGKKYNSLKNIMSNISPNVFENCYSYSMFHGDLQFDNIIYEQMNEKFTYIDWRDSFGGQTEGGDVYYDLAKLYGGCIINYQLMKIPQSIMIDENGTNISYLLNTSKELNGFREYYEKVLVTKGYNLQHIKLITGIIFLNMSPLHSENFGKLLWFKAIEMLSEYVGNNK
jgi:mannose-6-phosphate isomerase-like protein (cupin superfamily)